ncbi:Clp protease N-terminal domain-containing protein [Spongiactinospora sp. TRM90649]|uniref:Clp protease N-terminal domain-containing protein n=1 Tax=Spongiactinospora sp. TRM90649 TaxID=3031114 RepID=UPI0023F70549|nr:Clp protease N-terminal domain-containing protein [Spongiactinospora sp. TRM90649]MDF5752893.1 Clp protease N-terminal domain-containing protein [Spongiactinospora sp. TRM90649]
MPKINVYLPDELAEAVKASGVPVSAVCQRALEQAVRRVTAIREVMAGDLAGDDLAARFPHFTARTREVLKLSVAAAREDGAAEVGTEHLLGGMLAEGTNLALHVLRAAEIEPEQVGRALAAQTSRSGGSAPPETPDGETARFSGPAANALEMAVAEAHGLGHNYIGCEHLLLGLIAEPDGAGGQVLRSLGAEARLTRRAVVAALAGYVHLRAQGAGAGAAATSADPAKALAEAVGRAVEPLVRRIERLEERLDTGSGG